MFVHTKIERRGRLSSLAVLALFAVAIAIAVAAQPASGFVAGSTKPVIGKPTAVPAQPVAGKRFTVSFKVTQGVAGAPLTRGAMICHPWVAAQVLPHAESFKGGVARLAFAVPTSAAGKVLKVKVTIKAAGGVATRVSTFHVLGAAIPSMSIAGASIAEGSAMAAAMSFQVTLSTPATQPVSVDFATADGTATAPSDYAATKGTLTFARGQTVKAIPVTVVGDQTIEPDETFSVTLANPVNATIATGTATGTITNDDTAVPVTPGNYKGATQNGDYVFFTVTANRTITEFRMNAVAEQCSPGGTLRGSIDWTDSTFRIRADGSFQAEGSWSGSDVQGDYEWLTWSAKLTGVFTNSSTVTGTVVINDELKYKGDRYVCSTGQLTWSAALQG